MDLSGKDYPFIERLTFFTWYREPGFAPDYRELWELEKELSTNHEAKRWELLSIWRPARDEAHAQWAADIGTEGCQISFFGLEETSDYFTRRPGSFEDSLVATERCLDAGIRPRWQLFLTQRIIPELDALLALVDQMDLEQRVWQLGHDFEIFIHMPGPGGEGFRIEHLHPTADALTAMLYANFHVPVSELARRYGRRDSRLLYRPSDLEERWLRLWGEARYGDKRNGMWRRRSRTINR